MSFAPPSPPWHAVDVAEAVARAGSSAEGLSSAEAEARLRRAGPNALRAPPPTAAWRILWAQLSSTLVLLLLAAAAVAVLSDHRLDAVAIGAVLVINVALGFATELPARRAMEALRSLAAQRATVLRGGERREIDARELVPGDVIVLDAGQAVPADARLLYGADVSAAEAVLTGESMPVVKQADLTLPVDLPLPERRNMVYQGTTVVAGAARALVVATGTATEVGRIGVLVGAIPEEPTPLERRLDVLGRRLAAAALGVAALVAALELLQGRNWSEVLALGIALGIAAVPEGLPVVATVTLAVGVRRMARRRALIRRLSIVETLGSTTVVCTDKTGTLTTGQMTATTFWVAGRELEVTGAGVAPVGDFLERGAPVDPTGLPALGLALRVGVLASRADLPEAAGGAAALAGGDPTEIALVVAAAKAGLDGGRVRAEAGAEVGELPFSSARRLMAVYRRAPAGALEASVKGAPGRVAELCDLSEAERRELDDVNHHLAARGLRVLALARGPVGGTAETALHGLTFVGLVGLADPPAAAVEHTIGRLREAGIRTVMLTGDQRGTAEAIARGLGVLRSGDEVLDGREVDALSDDALAARVARVAAFARLTPEAKLRVVSAYQRRGEIVAMLGDGVNDAAALKKADVGVAMGQRGTDVAKATAGVVLQDDRFETIAAAVEEGRVIFDNLRKFVFYLFSCNLGEILVFLGAGIAGWSAPLLPLQILWLNLVTDTFPALALAFEPAEPGLMRRPPRAPRAAVLSAGMARLTIGYAALIALCTLAAVWWGTRASPLDPRHAATLAFMTLAVAQTLHLGNARSTAVPVATAEHALANRHAVAAVVLVFALQVAATQWLPLASVLGTVPLSGTDWLVVALLGAVPAAAGQAARALELLNHPLAKGKRS